MSAKNFRLLLPALALACMATFAFADEGQAAQHVADGVPVVADHVDHMGVLPGTLVARNDNGRHEGWYKDKPRPKGHYKKGPPPGPRPGYHRPGDRPGPRPASMTDAARAMMVPAPARGPIIGLTVPVPARALSFSG